MGSPSVVANRQSTSSIACQSTSVATDCFPPPQSTFPFESFDLQLSMPFKSNASLTLFQHYLNPTPQYSNPYPAEPHRPACPVAVHSDRSTELAVSAICASNNLLTVQVNSRPKWGKLKNLFIRNFIEKKIKLLDGEFVTKCAL